MNPVYQSDQIIKLRNRLLDIQTTDEFDAAKQSKTTKLRESTAQQIDDIRAQMWRQHPQRLAEMLRAVNVGEFPELKNAVKRLHQVISSHGQIQQLSSHPNQNINLVNTFKRVIMLPPRDAGALKESYLRQIIESAELKSIQRSVRLLQNEYPELYVMEADWLTQIQGLKGRAQTAHQAAGGSDESEAGVPGWLIWVVLVVVFRIIAAFIRNS